MIYFDLIQEQILSFQIIEHWLQKNARESKLQFGLIPSFFQN